MEVKSITKGSITLDITPEELFFLERALNTEAEHRKDIWERVSPSSGEELTFNSMAVELVVGMKVAVNDAMKTVKLNGVFK